jgi:predicted anti-sigma-YlaC factor YlaD
METVWIKPGSAYSIAATVVMLRPTMWPFIITAVIIVPLLIVAFIKVRRQ